MMPLTKDNPTTNSAPWAVQRVQPLSDEHRAETLNFLSVRPLHTFVMTGWVHDNGLVSPLNRGGFYGYRNTQGSLEGVALIGHTTLFETTSDAALAAFAGLTQNCSAASALMGEEQKVNKFLSYYIDGRPRPRLACSELLFEQRSKQPVDESVPRLCLATPNELDLVMNVHAEMALEETGVNPLEIDPIGFRRRCARRIQQERVWVHVEDNRLKFKADVISELPQVTYLEGVYVSPEKRGNGFGAGCVRQLTNTLLDRSKSVCLLIKEENLAAQACYRKAGYTLREYYQTLFFQQN